METGRGQQLTVNAHGEGVVFPSQNEMVCDEPLGKGKKNILGGARVYDFFLDDLLEFEARLEEIFCENLEILVKRVL